MTVFEKLKLKSIDEFAEWLDEYMMFDDSPWVNWWNETYCNKCEPVMGTYVEDDYYRNREMEFAWCELNENCRFFPDMDNVHDTKQMVKMWLESEVDEKKLVSCKCTK